VQAGIHTAILSRVTDALTVRESSFQQGHLTLTDVVQGGSGGRTWLENLAQRQHVFELGFGRPIALSGALGLGQGGVDEGSAVPPAPNVDVALGLECPQGFAQGHSAHAQALGELPLGGQAFARARDPEFDGSQQQLDGLFKGVPRPNGSQERDSSERSIAGPRPRHSYTLNHPASPPGAVAITVSSVPRRGSWPRRADVPRMAAHITTGWQGSARPACLGVVSARDPMD